MAANDSSKFLETHARGLAALLTLGGIPSPRQGVRFRVWNTANLQMVYHKYFNFQPIFEQGNLTSQI
jgi:hypothetical protein